jgi:tetratricopeptide (TPR) repeat protein
MNFSSLKRFLCHFTLSASAQKKNEAESAQIIQLCKNGTEFNKQGDFKAAQLTYNDAINKAKSLSSDNDHLLALCYELYGDNYYEWRVWGAGSTLNYADAKKYYVEAARIWYAAKGGNGPEVRRIYNKIGACWYKLENDEDASKWFNDALTVHESTISGSLNHISLTYRVLFVIYLDIVNYFYSERDYNITKFYLEELLALEKLINGTLTDIYEKLQHQLELLEKERLQDQI